MCIDSSCHILFQNYISPFAIHIHYSKNGCFRLVQCSSFHRATVLHLWIPIRRGGGARWPSGLERWLGLATEQFPAGFDSHCGNLALAIPFTPHCQCLSEETLKAVGPFFYLVSMPGEVKIPPVRTGMCNCRGLRHPL